MKVKDIIGSAIFGILVCIVITLVLMKANPQEEKEMRTKEQHVVQVD